VRKINFVVDGNFPRWVRLGLVLIGFGLMYGTFRFILPSIGSGILLLIGFGVAAIGGFSNRAAMLHIKPFDNSYKKARASYEVEDDKHDDPK
jgi:hypothetical protein